MYIKPIETLQATDIVKANCLRRLEVRKVVNDKKLVDTIFSRLKKALDYTQNKEIEKILSYELFFEVIPVECIASLSLMYLNLSTHNDREHCIKLLKDSYILKGNRGFLFSFMPRINKILL